MAIFKRLSFVALLALVLIAGQGLASVNDTLTQTKAQSQALLDIINKLESRHYRDMPVDDGVSKRFLENYLKRLDPSHMFFFASDIENFKKNELLFDNDFKKGDLSKSYEIYNTYQQRATSRIQEIIKNLNNSEVTFDFTLDDQVLVDRSEEPWPANKKQADKMWYKRIKLSLLNLKLAGKTLEEARETVRKRYENQLHRLEQEKGEDVFEDMANALTVLYDPHTNYWSPKTSDDFDINMSLSLEGIGAVLQPEDEFTKVVRLVAGGPADKQGQLQPADRILGVAQGNDGEFVDVVGWRLDDVVQLIRGKKDTLVRLQVLPAKSKVGETLTEVKIKRGKVKLEDQAAQKAILELPFGDIVYKIGVINLPTFYLDFEAYNRRDPNYKSSTRDVARLLAELNHEGVDGIILDLRNNGGGSLHEATQLTDLFIDQGPVVQIRSSDGRINRHNKSRFKAMYRGPLVVMVNRLSASASEIFAGAIQDYNRGIIVGSQTFGKGTVQSLTPVSEGRLKLTESKFYRVSGDSTQHRGVIPDISMPVLIDSEEVGESAYDNALPWDNIHPVDHSEYFNYSTLLPLLQNLHSDRADKNPDLIYLKDQLGIIEVNKNKKTISLNEKKRLSERDSLEKRSMEIDNKRRAAKQLPLYKSLEEYREAELSDETQIPLASRETKIDVDGDAMLIETGSILIDMIRLGDIPESKQAASF